MINEDFKIITRGNGHRTYVAKEVFISLPTGRYIEEKAKKFGILPNHVIGPMIEEYCSKGETDDLDIRLGMVKKNFYRKTEEEKKYDRQSKE